MFNAFFPPLDRHKKHIFFNRLKYTSERDVSPIAFGLRGLVRWSGISRSEVRVLAQFGHGAAAFAGQVRTPCDGLRMNPQCRQSSARRKRSSQWTREPRVAPVYVGPWDTDACTRLYRPVKPHLDERRVTGHSASSVTHKNHGSPVPWLKNTLWYEDCLPRLLFDCFSERGPQKSFGRSETRGWPGC